MSDSASAPALIVLTEASLGDPDVRNLESVLETGAVRPAVFLLVPIERRRNLLVEFIDQLSLLDLPAALRELGPQPDAEQARAEAQQILDESLSALAEAGIRAEGRLVAGEAVAGLTAEVKERSASQAVVITEPHAIEDTLRTDWASQAQQQLGLPVLHLYAGSGFIGDS
ncbi:hypothetical protein ODZ83_09375 [Acaricomes phytoseiuli]|uniref:hypothetical protein n=1 Tax=Acaricomes phytoseiuli TaxID=291968 RepID=UPI00037DDFAD|nr:hypothetical protein [Acaricomes phytoseiuli]MCW1250386.1 hypothetical protein [Acaricomes phytoseiuli]